MPHPINTALACWSRRLEQSGVDSPRLSAEILLAEALGLERNDLLKSLLLDPDKELTPGQARRFAALCARREQGEPAAYILGRKEFYGRDFCVGPAVLIPRPETEMLVDAALKDFGPAANLHRSPATAPHRSPAVPLFADFGTGSGCLAVTLALELPAWQGLALDADAAALNMAAHNARRLGAGNLGFVRADFTRPPLAPASLRLLVSNPPYVSRAEYQAISPEVRDHEPEQALVPRVPGGAARGTEDALRILALAPELLAPGGLLLMEIGESQARELLATPGAAWAERGVCRDLAGLDRLLFARKA